MDLSKKLDSTNKQLFKEENEERRSDLEREKQNLKDLVKFLSKEIEDLKTEIGLFKRKGLILYCINLIIKGVIYTRWLHPQKSS